MIQTIVLKLRKFNLPVLSRQEQIDINESLRNGTVKQYWVQNDDSRLLILESDYSPQHVLTDFDISGSVNEFLEKCKCIL